MSKHLTDAECAAEYWRMRWLVTGMARRFKGDSHLPDLFPVKEGDLHRFYDEMHTLQRFMEHPHAT